MNDSNKTILYTVVGNLLVFSLVSAVWLGLENKKKARLYRYEKGLWYRKNRELEFKLDRFAADMAGIKIIVGKEKRKMQELAEDKATIEQRVAELVADNKRLLENIARLTKDKENF